LPWTRDNAAAVVVALQRCPAVTQQQMLRPRRDRLPGHLADSRPLPQLQGLAVLEVEHQPTTRLQRLLDPPSRPTVAFDVQPLARRHIVEILQRQHLAPVLDMVEPQGEPPDQLSQSDRR